MYAQKLDDSATCSEIETSNKVLQFLSVDDLSVEVGNYVASLAHLAENRDKFLIALSGGSLPMILAKGLMSHADTIDFSKWHVFLADERHVPHDHPDSNMLLCRQHILDPLKGINPENVYGIDYTVPVEEAAARYQAILEKVSGTKYLDGQPPVLDVILLGMGPDGHTCSLFPGHKLLEEASLWVAPIRDSPKPPPQRITMTYPVLNAAKNVFFLVSGASKADVLPLTAGLSHDDVTKLGNESLPAARVRPIHGQVVWFVDEAAAAKL